MLAAVKFLAAFLSVVTPVIVTLETVQPSIVRGASMQPTLHDGDRIFVERMTPWLGSLHRGDVIVLNPPGRDEERYVKRIAGLPGDVVQIDHGDLTVGGEHVCTCRADAGMSHTWIVPQGECFVLGDNYEKSYDSRLFGTVPMERVVGRVLGK